MARSADLDTYKHQEYLRLGFTEYQAGKLIEVPGLDVGSVRTLVEKGCKVQLAYRIFRP